MAGAGPPGCLHHLLSRHHPRRWLGYRSFPGSLKSYGSAHRLRWRRRCLDSRPPCRHHDRLPRNLVHRNVLPGLAGNSFFLSHMGEINVALTSQKPLLAERNYTSATPAIRPLPPAASAQARLCSLTWRPVRADLHPQLRPCHPGSPGNTVDSIEHRMVHA